MQNKILTSINSSNYVANLKKKRKKKNTILYNPNVGLANDNVYTNFVYILSIHSQEIEQNQILKSIKGSFYDTNLRKMTLYNPIIGRVNDIVYTRFGLNLSISSKDMEQKPNSDANQWA